MLTTVVSNMLFITNTHTHTSKQTLFDRVLRAWKRSRAVCQSVSGRFDYIFCDELSTHNCFSLINFFFLFHFICFV